MVSIKKFSEIFQRRCLSLFLMLFRYEVAAELHDKIKIDPVLKGSVSLRNMISPIPSITKVGMAALLPNKDINYGADVMVDGQSTLGIQSRHKILVDRNQGYAAIRYDEMYKMAKQDLRDLYAR